MNVSRKISDLLAQKALAKYGMENSCRARFLQISENITYMFEDKTSLSPKAVLRISRPGYHTPEELRDELLWLDRIRKDTPVIVPNAFPGKDGSYIQTVSAPGAGGEFYCALYEFLKGGAPDENDEKQEIYYFKKLGEITACLHRQVKNWEGSSSLSRFVWNGETMIGDNARWGRWKAAGDLTAETTALLEKACRTVRRRLGAYGKGKERFGLIHADLRLANLLLDGSLVKVIDFDDCGYGWFLHDLASAVSFLETKPVLPGLIEAWLEGYMGIEPLTQQDLDEIGTFIMQRRLQLLAWLASHSGSQPVKALSMGYTEGTAQLAERYLSKYAVTKI